MISVLAQERLLGAALGAIVVFEQRRCIYSSISGTKPQSAASHISEPIFGRKARAEFAHHWNKSMDQTFRPLIESLSQSGWNALSFF